MTLPAPFRKTLRASRQHLTRTCLAAAVAALVGATALPAAAQPKRPNILVRSLISLFTGLSFRSTAFVRFSGVLRMKLRWM